LSKISVPGTCLSVFPYGSALSEQQQVKTAVSANQVV
jgi:hypothetical protein